MSKKAFTKLSKKNMSKIKTLERYTVSIFDVAEFRKKHARVFDELDGLRLEVQKSEEALKTDVKENIRMNIANDFIKVTYSPAFHKSYRHDVIVEKTTPKMYKAIEKAKAITHSVDKAIFEMLVEQGVIPVEVKQAAFEERELAPRVTIKEVKKNEQE